ncbi:MAG: peroxiredoxin [Thiobacillus sp.]
MNTWIAGAIIVTLTGASAGLWMLQPAARALAGEAAPDFALLDQQGQPHRLADYRGRWLVLYFYPRDDTPGCTEEACRFRDNIGLLGELGAAVVGVSIDNTQTHARFAARYQLPFPLLSDLDGKIAARYGSLLNLGLIRFARRHTFIIAPDGRIAERFDHVKPASHAQQVADALRRLRHAG